MFATLAYRPSPVKNHAIMVRLKECSPRMPTSFAQAVAEWQTFYFALGTAAATLTGLLFVAVSLHLEQMVGQEHPEIRALAYRTLSGFVHLLFISLYFLMPRLTPLPLAGALIVTTVAAAAI